MIVAVGGVMASAEAQEIHEIEATNTEISMKVGESIPFEVTAYDENGYEVDARFRFGAPRQAIEIYDGQLTAKEAGEYEFAASLQLGPDQEWAGSDRPVIRISVTVEWPEIEFVEIEKDIKSEVILYEGTTIPLEAKALHEDGSLREDAEFTWRTDDTEIATIDRFGNLTAHQHGAVTVTAETEYAIGEKTIEVHLMPEDVELEITGGAYEAQTGDVLNFEAEITDGDGHSVYDVPVSWSANFTPSEEVGEHAGAAALISSGKFVGSKPGYYTITARAGNIGDQKTLRLKDRKVVHEVTEIGHGRVNHKHTSDFWVFEGNDGNDYAITGTWGADGMAYFWDVNDPEDPVKYDSIQVDARTVNDVKVSPDSRYAVLTREGASDRRNGLIIVDLANPANPVIAAEYDEGLTGGVHNTFPTEDHIFALSAGEKFVILDVTDIENPEYVSEYKHPNARIHDVHVKDGIAYASQWAYGVVIVDVGHGKWGGSIENPVFVTNVTTPGGRTHATFPYYSESTDRFYLFLGDEILHRNERPLGAGGARTLHIRPYDPETDEGGRPSHTDGYIHILDWTDKSEDPEIVAKYHVPEYGTHNIWVKDDILYQAYYEGGARMVDVSGELKGDLHGQGREMAVFKPYDPNGYIANAPMVWTVYPFKDKIWFSDWNSGLWVIDKEPLDY